MYFVVIFYETPKSDVTQILDQSKRVTYTEKFN
jgi:hypothetical protein